MTSPMLLLDIDGTLCPFSPGPEVVITQLSTGDGPVWFRADLPEVLAELAAHYELAWATAWHEHANLPLAPALGLPALPVVHFTDPAPDQVGSRYAGRTLEAAQHPALRGRSAPGLDRRRPAPRRLHVGGDAADPDQADHNRTQPRDHRPGRPQAAGFRTPTIRWRSQAS
jgi:hypothetical protein